MDKKILYDYIDACEYIRETEKEIKYLEKQKKDVLQDKVYGSNPDYPYEQRSFNIIGTAETPETSLALKREMELLEIQKKEAEDLKLKVEEWMGRIPFRMQRIIRFKIFKEKSWEEVATLMGRKATADSIRMEFNSFMKK